MQAVFLFRVLFVRTASLGSVFARWGRGFFFAFGYLRQWHWAQCSLGGGGGYFFLRFGSKNSVIALSVSYVEGGGFFQVL